MKTKLRMTAVVLGLSLCSGPAWAAYNTRTNGPQDILKQALMGAGTGALSAELSGGKAGKGALIGAGTQVIGGALISLIFDSPAVSAPAYPTASYSPPVYSSYTPALSYDAPSYTSYTPYVAPPVQTVQTVYKPVYVYQPQTVYAQPSYSYAPRYARPSTADDSNRRILRQGLMGAGVGAISAEVSGGKAGTGALVGAGTNVIGSALLELLTA